MPIDPRFLLDTNICIYLLEGRGGEIVRRRIEAAVRGALVTSTIVQAEVMIGADRRDMLSTADALFTIIPPLPFDQFAARTYASLPFRRGNLDRLIAAHAISLDLTLVTNNERDFADIPGLRVENWTR